MTADTAIRPAILAGGQGTRLWPLSSPDCPKQFLRIAGRPSTFQDALARAAELGPGLVIASAAHAALVRRETQEAGWAGEVILEPLPRDSGLAMAIAALATGATHPGSLLLAMPADHVIADRPAFQAAVRRGAGAARAGSLVLFGARAESPEPGLGYIRMSAAPAGAPGPFPVSGFIEKPERTRAAELMAEGALWNCGMFLAAPNTLVRLFADLAPDILSAARLALAGGRFDQGARILEADALAGARRVSFDHAIVAKAESLAVVPTSMGWRDVGTWETMTAWLGADGNGNFLGPGALVVESGNCIVHGEGLRPVLVGVSDLVVIAANGQLLVMARDRLSELKTILDRDGTIKI